MVFSDLTIVFCSISVFVLSTYRIRLRNEERRFLLAIRSPVLSHYGIVEFIYLSSNIIDK